MISSKTLPENNDSEAFKSTLQIGHRFLRWRSDDKQEKQAKKDYFEASDSVLEIGYFLGSNRVQREFYGKSSKM